MIHPVKRRILTTLRFLIQNMLRPAKYSDQQKILIYMPNTYFTDPNLELYFELNSIELVAPLRHVDATTIYGAIHDTYRRKICGIESR